MNSKILMNLLLIFSANGLLNASNYSDSSVIDKRSVRLNDWNIVQISIKDNPAITSSFQVKYRISVNYSTKNYSLFNEKRLLYDFRTDTTEEYKISSAINDFDLAFEGRLFTTRKNQVLAFSFLSKYNTQPFERNFTIVSSLKYGQPMWGGDLSVALNGGYKRRDISSTLFLFPDQYDGNFNTDGDIYGTYPLGTSVDHQYLNRHINTLVSGLGALYQNDKFYAGISIQGLIRIPNNYIPTSAVGEREFQKHYLDAGYNVTDHYGVFAKAEITYVAKSFYIGNRFLWHNLYADLSYLNQSHKNSVRNVNKLAANLGYQFGAWGQLNGFFEFPFNKISRKMGPQIGMSTRIQIGKNK